jgi:hypothetical protein
MILNKKGQKNSDYLAPIYLRRYSMGEAESGQIITPPSPLIQINWKKGVGVI